MKTDFIKYSAITAILIFCTACEKSLETYNAGSGLNFLYVEPKDTLVNYSFVYGPQSTTSDTVWLKLETIGELADQDREVSIEQLTTGVTDAKAGIHYVAFDDPLVKNSFVIRAKKSIDSVPVILKRDPSLKDGTFTALLQVKSNDKFQLTNPQRRRVRINVTDQLIRPANWAIWAGNFLGKYGPVKHQWLIDQTGKRWDDPYMFSLGYTSTGVNQFRDDIYSYYMQVEYTKLLAVTNAQRAALGLGVLTESDGRVVSFARYTGAP